MANGDKLVLGQSNFASSQTSLGPPAGGVLPNAVLVIESTGPAGLFVIQEGPAPSQTSGGGVVCGANADNYGVVGAHYGGQGDRGSVFAGVRGQSDYGTGVLGDSGGPFGYGVGVHGYSAYYHGVIGQGQENGVYGYSAKGTGVVGQSASNRDTSFGVFAWGRIACTGTKHAAVPHADGKHRLLYSMESTECWFEDFGTARLRRGVAKVPIARDFAPLVRTNGYHVFVTPEGDCNGLCVMKKTARGFTVRELGGGATNIAFAFRIVAKRKDLAAPRLPRVKLVEPKAPRPAGKPRLPRVPRKARKPSRA